MERFLAPQGTSRGQRSIVKARHLPRAVSSRDITGNVSVRSLHCVVRHQKAGIENKPFLSASLDSPMRIQVFLHLPNLRSYFCGIASWDRSMLEPVKFRKASSACTGCQCTGRQFSGCRRACCRFAGCEFAGCRLTGCPFTGCQCTGRSTRTMP